MILENDEIHYMQRSFRVLMDAFAHPGTVRELPACEAPIGPTGLAAPFDTLVRLFVDQATTLWFVGDEATAQSVLLETRTKRAAVDAAAFVAVPASAGEEACAQAVAQACGGTLVSPEKGATVFVECSRLAAEPVQDLACLQIEGPGVKDANRFYAASARWAWARNGRGDEYPCGIEIVLFDAAGRVVAVPRSSQVTIVEGGR